MSRIEIVKTANMILRVFLLPIVSIRKIARMTPGNSAKVVQIRVT